MLPSSPNESNTPLKPENNGPSGKRIGIFGGSFDPVHKGHLALAEACYQSAGLDQLWFIPTTIQPLKPYGPVASNAHRLAMLKLAVADLETIPAANVVISPIETNRGGTSYTVDTLRSIKAKQASAAPPSAASTSTELFLLMGADTLSDFQKWHEPAEVLRLATPLVVQRAEEPAPDFNVLTEYVSQERLTQIEQLMVTMPPMPISSSEIRKRIAAGEPIEEWVPASVGAYLKKYSLYQ